MRALLADPVLRLCAWLALLFGASAATHGVHMSLVAVERLGLSDGQFAWLLFASLLVAITTSVTFGIAADRGPWRRGTALASGVAATAYPLIVWTWPTRTGFALAIALVMPCATAFFGQLFAMARLAAARHANPGATLALLRALFALPFVLVLPVWSVAFARGVPVLAIYPAIAAINGALLLLIWARWPRDDGPGWADPKSGLGIRASLGELADPGLQLRVALIGLLHLASFLQGALVGLTFAQAGRGPEDAPLFFAAFVAVEVLVTLALMRVPARLPRLSLIAAGVVLMAAYIAALPWLAGSGWVWALAVVVGVGGALIYTLAIAYLQDLMAARPGAGSALIALNRLSCEGTGALIYGAGSAIGGYALVGATGAVVMLAAMATLWRLDLRRRSPVPPAP